MECEDKGRTRVTIPCHFDRIVLAPWMMIVFARMAAPAGAFFSICLNVGGPATYPVATPPTPAWSVAPVRRSMWKVASSPCECREWVPAAAFAQLGARPCAPEPEP